MEKNSNTSDKKTNSKEREYDRLEKKELIINAYNEKYGMSYSYGEFVALLARGKLLPLPEIF